MIKKILVTGSSGTIGTKMMFKKLKNKIEQKRTSKSLFWKILILGKDFTWKSLVFGKNLITIRKNLFWKLFIFGKYLIWKIGRKDKKIIMLMPYFGNWPVWIDLYIESCKWNPSINWLFFTDCGLPKNKAMNVKYVHMSLDDFNKLASSKLNIPVNITCRYKLCDFRPTYGLIFEDYLKGYNFWGHGDIDLIYGNIRKFVTDELLKFDVISFHSHKISGHFALYRNCPRMNKKFTKINNWQTKLMMKKNLWMDEHAIYNIINKNKCYLKEMYSTPSRFNAWKDGTFNFPTEWYWNKGKLTNNKDDSEYLCFHFMVWKFNFRRKRGYYGKKTKIINFDINKPIKRFKITKKGFLNYDYHI